jgi:hypothetical protein
MKTHQQSHRKMKCKCSHTQKKPTHSAEWARDPTTGDLVEVWQCMGCGEVKPRRVKR